MADRKERPLRNGFYLSFQTLFLRSLFINYTSNYPSTARFKLSSFIISFYLAFFFRLNGSEPGVAHQLRLEFYDAQMGHWLLYRLGRHGN